MSYCNFYTQLFLSSFILIESLREKPIIRDITYEGFGKLELEEIESYFKINKVKIAVEKRYDYIAAKEGKKALKKLLKSKGIKPVKIQIDIEAISPTTVAVKYTLLKKD